jgi:hypothetical protein
MSERLPMDELPIACTLGAGDFEARERELVTLGRQSLVSVERTDDGPVVLRFKADAATTAELRRIVAAEAECCPFLKLTLTEGTSLSLAIDGPDAARPVIEGLVDRFQADAA